MFRPKYFLILFFLFGCGVDKPSEDMIFDELKTIKYHIINNLGEDYNISNLKITKSYFVDKDYFKCEFSFVINKQFTNPNPKKIDGYLLFYRIRYNYWVIKKNSIIKTGILNLIE